MVGRVHGEYNYEKTPERILPPDSWRAVRIPRPHPCGAVADAPGPNTPGSASNPGVIPPIQGHIKEIRRYGRTGVCVQNRMKFGRTQRPGAKRMSSGNVLPFPVPLIPGRERERGRESFRYRALRISSRAKKERNRPSCRDGELLLDLVGGDGRHRDQEEVDDRDHRKGLVEEEVLRRHQFSGPGQFDGRDHERE